MMIVSLRGAFFATKQSPVREGCFVAYARNDMSEKVNALRALQAASRDALGRSQTWMPSILYKAFKGQL